MATVRVGAKVRRKNRKKGAAGKVAASRKGGKAKAAVTSKSAGKPGKKAARPAAKAKATKAKAAATKPRKAAAKPGKSSSASAKTNRFRTTRQSKAPARSRSGPDAGSRDAASAQGRKTVRAASARVASRRPAAKPARPRSSLAAKKKPSRSTSKPAAKSRSTPLRVRPPKPARRPAVASRKQAARRTIQSRGRATQTVRRTSAGAARLATSTPRTARAPRRTAAGAQTRGRHVKARDVAVTGDSGPRYDEILTPEALQFLAGLHRKFDGKRKALLAARIAEQARYDAGALPDFLVATRHIRESAWKVATIPAELLDRRVEITGPVDRKMVINALNSGANVYMADLEDANSPTWANNVEGQINLKDRWADALDFTDPETGRAYALASETAVLIVRPRGWHLLEEHLTVDGEPISGALFDFGLYFFHNIRALLARGTQPYFYLPKLETHQEARLWNEVFVHAQEQFQLPLGVIKATVLIETLPAAFEMDEILWEMRDHVVGLNAGRWDYIFSFIKKLANNPDYVLPDRGQVVMGKAFLGAYAALLVKTCHRRGAFAMGGMAAQIPVRNDSEANEQAFARVRADKEREARDGHDGTWVAHPDLVPIAKDVFDRLMPGSNQLDRMRDDVVVTRDDLLLLHEGGQTEEGFRHNIRVGVQYIEAWLRGRGAVPIYNMMEDAATAEISRAQIWQWIKYSVTLDTGVTATPEFFRRALAEEMQRVSAEMQTDVDASGRFPEAVRLFSELSLASEFEDFLTIPAYRLIA